MKIDSFTLCLLLLPLVVSAQSQQQNTQQFVTDSNQQQMRAQQPVPERKNVQLSTPLPFSQDLSTQPVGQQAYDAFQKGFPNAFGMFNTHNPNAPSFSVDPMISSGSVNLAAQNGQRQYAPGSLVGNQFMPLIRNGHSLTTMQNGGLSFGSSLTAGVFPSLRPKDHCELVQRQAVQVANNIVKRQNKVVFKELMNYILKSKFLIGMTEVKLNRVLRRKFVALMKKYSEVSDDNIRLIQSEDEEILDDDIEDETDDLKDDVDYQDPFKSNAIDIDEDNIDWRDVNNDGKSLTPEDIARIDGGISPTVVPDTVPTPNTNNPAAEPAKPAEPEKKPWYKRIFDWKQQRALAARKARQQKQRRQNLS